MDLVGVQLLAAYLLANVVAGLVACFFGRRLFFLMLGALVFLGVLNATLGATDASPASLALAIVLGVAAALLSKFAYRAAVFLLGLGAGAGLGLAVAALLPQDAAGLQPLVALGTGVLVGLLGVRWSDAVVRWGTAWAGAGLVVPNALAAALSMDALLARVVPGDALATFDALSGFVGGEFAAAYGTPILVGTVALAVAGALVQSRSRG